MNAHFFDFASQNQKNGHSFIIFFRRRRRRKSFETASEGVFGAHGGPKARRAPNSR
jgi:hypothetical protein